ncbi:mur ligase middle domain protein, partial [Vibrio parahaemolyticus EKP-028]
GHQCALGL